ncbi:MAG: glycosyltransferase family 39 protein, partial [Methylococcales bacterium]|nr:glycosyltransferase family 39 protein [Methylococcales bacterium]
MTGKRLFCVVVRLLLFQYDRWMRGEKEDMLQSSKVARWQSGKVVALFVLILATAVSLRLYSLPNIPPGLTHDEADHGITAWNIVNGSRAVYFTIGYGREPLYDYATAAVMSLLGPTFMAGRLTAVAFSLCTLIGMTAWVRRAFDTQTALLTAAGLAVSFWPLMSARQMLRSVTLPALFVWAVYFFWLGVGVRDWRLEIGARSISNLQSL